MKDGIERSLTPSAKMALDSYMNELRDEILNEARVISAGISDYPEIGVSEVLEAIRSQQGKRERDRVRAGQVRDDRRRLTAVSTAAVGAACLTIAVVILSVRTAQSTASPSANFLAALVSAGATLVVTSLAAYNLVNTRRRYRIAEESSIRVQRRAEGELLSEWADFKFNLDRFTADKFGDSAAGKNFPDKTEMLVKFGELTAEDVAKIADIYELRNRIAHRYPDQPNQREIESAVADLHRIVTSLARRNRLWRDIE